MGKVNVGVGENFEVDENVHGEQAGHEDARAAAFRHWREERRRMREDMRAAGRAFREKMREACAGESGDDRFHHHHRHHDHRHRLAQFALGALAVLALVALAGRPHQG